MAPRERRRGSGRRGRGPRAGSASLWSAATLPSASAGSMLAKPESRDQVGVTGRNIYLSRPAFDQRAGDDERHMGGLLVSIVPLLVQAAVGAVHFAMVRGEDHNRILVLFRGPQCLEHTSIFPSTSRSIW